MVLKRTRVCKIYWVIIILTFFSWPIYLHVLVSNDYTYQIILDATSQEVDIKNIGDIMNEREQYNKYQMTILYYSLIFRERARKTYIGTHFGEHLCNITDDITKQMILNQQILVTDHVNLEKYATALIFHGPDSNGIIKRNKSEYNPMDIYIYHNMEPPVHSKSLLSSEMMKQYDLFMSYHFDADISLPYIDRGTLFQLIDTPILVSFEEKTKMGAYIAWVGSNCGAHNGRTIYLRELFKYIATHSYGSCLKTFKYIAWPYDKPLVDLIKYYKFYIVLENSNCKEYITEKLGVAIKASTVPVVFSVNNTPNYDYYMPPNSYINVADFNSAKELAEYLIMIGNNETLYNEYLYYKFNAMKSEQKKQIERENIMRRFKHKEAGNIWCNTVNAVWNYYRHSKLNGVRTHVNADQTCLDKEIMAEYIGRT